METQRRAGVSESGPLPSKATAAAVRRAPLGLLAELTHRCPLQCPYCSNPLHLDGVGAELDTGTWQDVMRQAAQLGVLQVHLSGGEPTARRDLEEIVASAADAGLYTNLITAGVLLDRARTEELAARGLDHVQLSIQDVEPANADRIARRKGAHDKKREVARWIREIGLPLTVNATVHRQNLDRLEGVIAFAVEAGDGRLEIAHVQYYGWALANRAALMPTRAQVERSLEIVEEARAQLKGVLVMCPPSELAGRWSRRLSDPLTAFASGWMRVRARARQRRVELPLVVSDHADWPELIDTIAETGASEVWVTHGREDALVHALTMRGLSARALSLVGFEDEGD